MQRTAWLYLLTYGVLGAYVPYIALHLRDMQVQGIWLVLAMAALPAGRMVSGPVWGVLADRFQSPGRVLSIALAMTIAGLLWVQRAHGALAALAVFFYAFGRGPVAPILDSIVLMRLGPDRDRYGQIRRYGSLGFLLAAAGCGWGMETAGIPPLQVALVLSVLALGLALPMRERGQLDATPVWGPLQTLLNDASVRWILLAAMLHFAAHVCISMFLALHFENLGIPVQWAGFALGAGVMVEVVLLSWAQQLLLRFGPRPLYVLAIGAAVPRWLITAWADEVAVLVGIQLLHGVTFGLFWVAGVSMIARRASQEIQASSQAVFSAAVGGLGASVGAFFGTMIADNLGTEVLYQVAAVVAVAATLCATQVATAEGLRPVHG